MARVPAFSTPVIATEWMEAEAARASQRIVVVRVWLFAIVMMYPYIQDVFNESGVQIMSPHFIADKDHPVVVPPENWHRAPATSGDTGQAT